MIVVKEPNWSDEIKIPRAVATCPDCETELTISPNGWQEGEEAGVWKCNSFTSWCEHYDDEEKYPHPSYDMPYIYWLPIDVKIEKWLANNYCFVEA